MRSDDPCCEVNLPWPDRRAHALPVKGRGTATRLAHRFESVVRAREDDGWHDEGEGAKTGVRTVVTEERCGRILSKNDSPDIPFSWAINPYRGCEHGCIYCYARPTHSYLNLSPGLDFETQLVAKVNAAERLRDELAASSYQPSPIQIGSVTDAYQPCDRQLGLTRQVLAVLDEVRHPFTIVTKSSLVERDMDLLQSAASRNQAYVMISITTLDSALSWRLEPRAVAPHRRLETVASLAQAGVPVGVNVAPIIPFLNEPEIERIIEAAAQAGARSIHYTVVRLPWEVNPLFQQWLADHVPDQAERIMARIRDLRGGRDYDADFRHRMKGDGQWAKLIAQRVLRARQQFGLGLPAPDLDCGLFQKPPRSTAVRRAAAQQGQLFD